MSESVRRGRSPGASWARVSRGAHRLVVDGAGDDALVDELRAWRLVLPESVALTHLTGAQLHQWWLPPLPHDLPVFASGGYDDASMRPGLVLSRHRVEPPSEVENGLRVAEPAEILLACARDVGLLDLVVLIDSALRAGDCRIEDLHEVARKHRRGAPLLRQALPLADPRSESPWETLLRLLHVVCEIPVQPQFEIVDDDEALVARVDLWLKGTNVIHEYDGATHLERRRQRKDLRRAREIDRVRWRRHGYTSVEVLHQAMTILRDADEAIGRRHDPGRIRPWHELLRESLFTPAGMNRFRRRLGLVRKTVELGA